MMWRGSRQSCLEQRQSCCSSARFFMFTFTLQFLIIRILLCMGEGFRVQSQSHTKSN